VVDKLSLSLKDSSLLDAHIASFEFLIGRFCISIWGYSFLSLSDGSFFSFLIWRLLSEINLGLMECCGLRTIYVPGGDSEALTFLYIV